MAYRDVYIVPYLISIEAFSYVTKTSNKKYIYILPDTYKRPNKRLLGRVYCALFDFYRGV